MGWSKVIFNRVSTDMVSPGAGEIRMTLGLTAPGLTGTGLVVNCQRYSPAKVEFVFRNPSPDDKFNDNALVWPGASRTGMTNSFRSVSYRGRPPGTKPPDDQVSPKLFGFMGWSKRMRIDCVASTFFVPSAGKTETTVG